MVNHTTTVGCLIRWLCVFLFLQGTGQAQSPAQLVERLQEAYERMQSFSADFDQIFHGHNVQLRETGIVMMKKPGKMYWEYQRPTKKLFVADGTKSYFYVPRDKQVIISELALESEGTPLLFLVGKGNIGQDFEVESELETQPLQAGNRVVRLTPKQPQGQFSHVILEIDPSDYLIQRLIVVEPIGVRNEYILNNLQENRRIPDRQFEFKIPDQVEVLRQ